MTDKKVSKKESEKIKSPSKSIGVDGYKISSGFVHEEFLYKLQGPQGRKVYREMMDNDATIGAILYAIELVIRSVNFKIKPAIEEDSESMEKAELVEGMFNDMCQPFENVVSEALTMLGFGWSTLEMVFKRRDGMGKADGEANSKYDDGLIGIKKLASRAQETLDKWEHDEDGRIKGMWQNHPNGGDTIYLPIDKLLHFATLKRKNNPEGKSVLRNAYTSWYRLKNIQHIEAIGIERELAGLPVVKIPADAMLDDSAEGKQVVQRYLKIARDLKFNEQAGILIPSDTYEDSDGKPTSIPRVSVELLASSGTRAIDTDKIVARYERNIGRSVLADFLFLGDGSGSYALSEDKTQLFITSLQTYLKVIASEFNCKLIPTIWMLNGFDYKYMPTFEFDDVVKADLEKLGSYLQSIAATGVILSDDLETENHLRQRAGLPMRDKDPLTDMLDLNVNDPEEKQPRDLEIKDEKEEKTDNEVKTEKKSKWFQRKSKSDNSNE